jgi:hypothetical protein
MSSIDLTGRWIGHYFQHGQAHSIVAVLLQDGERLTGSMRDGQTDHEYSVFEIALKEGLPPGADEQIVEKLREVVPDVPSRQIRYVSHLPSDAILEGRCRGRTVSLLKTYQGVSFGGYRVGDKLIGVEMEGQAVHYEGRLSPDGRTIEGRWWIDARPEAGTQRAEGDFELGLSAEGRSPDER